MFSSVVRAPRANGSITPSIAKVLPTAIPGRQGSTDNHPHGQVLRAARPVGLVTVVAPAHRHGTLVAPEEGPGRLEAVRAPSAVPATAALSARQVSAARPAAARALAEVAEAPAVAEDSAAEEAPAAAVAAEEAVEVVAEDAGKMETTGNCRSYRDTLWRERE